MSRHGAVVGWGQSGQGAAGALLARGWRVSAFDARGAKALSCDDVADVSVHVEEDPEALVDALIQAHPDLVVVSPGIPAHHPVFTACEEAGIDLWGEVELAWRLQEEGPHAGRPWLTVTGTNGKTTTVGMLGEILRSAGRSVLEVGNIGTPITRAIDSDAEVFAVELSSFQLHTTRSVSPLASICLNVDADHLDWHGSVEAYAADKARIYENTIKACVYPASDRRVETMVENADVIQGARAIGLTLGSPSVSQFGIVDGLLVDRAFVEDRDRHAVALAHVSDLTGAYGPRPFAAALLDALAAAALARAYGVEPEAVGRGLSSFRPAGHRRTIIGRAADLTWVDDSKATNAHAARASLAGLPPRSVIWIVGGDAKGQDFRELIAQVEPTLRGVVVIGAKRAPLVDALTSVAPEVPFVEVDGHEDWMFSVVNEAVALSRPGDTVVFAPAHASWDQFDNYGQRGDAFVEAVSRLRAQWGSTGGDE
ncbi:UDP-N-acetylmuramoyl-L-alanyl-D-glutamate synthetase [Schaalia meyeri]|uniref:UDP-N-acetylmuramoylalanine--D-glutamate ligase n=1 Tax=Schaalia meyeri TaxID=52773 RepID=A0AAQ0BY26_9ACTO|nr:UDP-N-acetylmuramoyl-L-alanine--D-glutamate ligase [Schaalia meyeri]AKU64716.1 UDP-N-acetylmuramoyl-L-alanyl-D-glutamate synthetase [Schaalia meyeri]OFQ24509.1 UDP-N-acetylmuramoylalanine--D-glutamate ligase [Actinomyces sp. HMSC062G12]QQC44618.1 UDP-N-acetylmuramoyl-L-alanine--D-glutamate ligase [Schaalia meyeri]SDR64452.1 UDP-N-acetylmuramoylalanine--D-glutamate ligase [Schaalia meyeri]